MNVPRSTDEPCILLHVYQPFGPRHDVDYDAIGPFENDAAVKRFMDNPAVGGDRGFVKVPIQTPEEVIKYFESRF